VRSRRSERLQFPALSPPIRELEVTIESHQTYMNLTDAFFKQTFVVDL
jgi:hypothetical protein